MNTSAPAAGNANANANNTSNKDKESTKPKPKPNRARPRPRGANRPHAKAKPKPAVDPPLDQSPADTDSPDDDANMCVLCCQEIDNETRFDTVGCCNHHGCCSLCMLRMRQLLGSMVCALCKTEMPRVICIENEDQTFESFQDWGDNIGPTHVFDEASGMFFLKREMPRVRRLRDPVCPKCERKFSAVAALKTHVLDVHQLHYCALCLDHKHKFLQEQPVFTKEQLKTHSVKGNPHEGFPGHPRCDFCFSRFYSNTELFDHLRKNHFECDICLRSLHIQNRYYKDYHDLENHFRADHFLCEEGVCLAKKFVVFASHLDLQAHMTVEHPHIKVNRKIDVHFSVRRAAPYGGGSDDNHDSEFEDHGHLLQEGATPHANVINVADFPSLSDYHNSGGLQVWDHQTVTRPHMEDFPELPSASSSGGARTGVAAPSFRNALTPAPTPAMMAHMNNDDGWEYPDMAVAAAALGANNPFLRFVKPKKKKKSKAKTPSPTQSPPPSTSSAHFPAEEAAAAEAEAPSAREDEEKAATVVVDEEDEEEESTANISKTALVLKIRQVLGSDAKYEVFREECRKYRQGETDVASFYAQVREMFAAHDFETLFLKLMRLSPDPTQVREVFAYHKDYRKQRKVTQDKKFETKQPKKQERKPKRTAPAPSGWANALRQSGIGSPGPVVMSAPRRSPQPSPPRTPPPVVTAVSSGPPPSTTKITSIPADAAPIRPTAPVSGGTYAQTTTQSQTFRNSKDDFPGLPKPGKAIGVQPVTRATWDEEMQTIAQNRPVTTTNTNSNGKKNKKKAMPLAEFAMRFG